MCAGTHVDDSIPVIVKMHVECTRCGHVEDETYESGATGDRAPARFTSHFP